MGENSGDLSLGYMMGQSEGNSGSGGMFNGDAFWGIILLVLLFGGRGFGGGFGGFGGGGGEYSSPCATQADVRAAVDQQTLISKLDQQTYGLADTYNALNNTLSNNFRGIDNAICTLGYQNQTGINSLSAQLAQCCCDTRAAIQENTTQGVMNTNSIQRQISDCCCDLEKMNMQNRFDAQVYNSGTLQAIDKLGDRILNFMVQEKMSSKDAEIAQLQNRLSQSEQNGVIRAAIDASTAEIIRRTGNECPVPSYLVQPPTAVNFPVNSCGTVQFGGNYGANNCGCVCGCG